MSYINPTTLNYATGELRYDTDSAQMYSTGTDGSLVDHTYNEICQLKKEIEFLRRVISEIRYELNALKTSVDSPTVSGEEELQQYIQIMSQK